MGRKRLVRKRSLAPTQPVDCLSYVDTIRTDFPVGVKKEQLRPLRAALLSALRGSGGKVVARKFPWRNGLWYWVFFIHQPSISALQVLAETLVPFCIREVHVALDLTTERADDAIALKRHVESLLLPSSRPAKCVEYSGRSDGSAYFNKGTCRGVEVALYSDKPSKVERVEYIGRTDGSAYFSKGTRRGVEVASYSDKLSKVDPGRHCFHLEWRIRGAKALRSMHLASIPDVLRLNHREFWDSQLALYSAPSQSQLRAARDRVVRSSPDERRRSSQSSARLAHLLLRASLGPSFRPVATDLLGYLNLLRCAFGARSKRLFKRQSHQWMLPCELNALWRQQAAL